MAAPAWGTRERPWPIAVSTLDAWKWFNQSEMTDEEFRHRLEHQDKPTVEAQVGQALHRAVEVLMMDVRTGGPVSLQSLVGMHREEPDVSFLFALDSGLDINLDHCMIVEQDVQWTINTGLGWVTLRGITDAIHGTVIRDIKTTRSFKATRYQDSWQWRAYLAMMGAPVQAVPVSGVRAGLSTQGSEAETGSGQDQARQAETGQCEGGGLP